MRVLVTGVRGLLGPYIIDECEKNGWEVTGTTKDDCDLRCRNSVKSLMRCEPDAIIHAAAETDVDYCEKEPLRAIASNRDATENLIHLMPWKTKFIYISTDMVYPDQPGPHLESETGPVNMYGKSKLFGEKVVRMAPKHLILRTNFFGPSKTPGRYSFSDWVVQSLTGGPTAVFFNDVYWTPLHAKTLCTVICEALERKLHGTYNLGSKTIMTKSAFAGAIAERFGLLEQFNKANISQATFKTKRPRDLSLDINKIESMGWNMPRLEEEIKKL